MEKWRDLSELDKSLHFSFHRFLFYDFILHSEFWKKIKYAANECFLLHLRKNVNLAA